MSDKSEIFTAILFGVFVGGTSIWFFRNFTNDIAVQHAKQQVIDLKSQISEREKSGMDERLQGLETIPAGNGTAYLYDSMQGKIWAITVDGIKKIPSPKD